MASPVFPFIFDMSKSQRDANVDDVGAAPAQQFSIPVTFSCLYDVNTMCNSLDYAQSFSYYTALTPCTRHVYGGYLPPRVSLAAGLRQRSWNHQYFCRWANRFVCYETHATRTRLFDVHWTRNSVLAHDKADWDSMLNPKHNAPRLSLEKTHSHMSLHPTVSSCGSLTVVRWLVEMTGYTTPAKTVGVAVRLQTENKADDVAWTACRTHVIQARAFLQVTVKKSLSDEDTNKMLVIDLPKRRSLDMNGQEVTKMPRQTTRASAALELPPEPHSVGVEVKTYEAFSSKYLLMKEIGEGSFSIVHRAVNRMTGQVCAVKCCKVSRALEEEERLLRTLSHPNVVSLDGVFKRDEHLHYVVMDYLKDGDMCDQLIERQRLPEPEARCIIRQVVEGLAYLHRRCVLHRDIKPENILIHGNIVKIADFGLAKELEQPTTLLKHSCGTLEYAAPELLCGQPYGLKSDVFSLGIVLYVLLFGAFPFSMESAAALQCMDHFPTSIDVRDMSCLSSSNVQWRMVSPLAQDALLKMLKTNGTERISAEELLHHPWFNEADAGMSKSVSSTPKDWELSRIEDCEAMGFAELLSRGFQVVKYGYIESTMPYVTSLSLDFMKECINWTACTNSQTQVVPDGSENAAVCRAERVRVISLRDIKEIREGHTTTVFLSHNMKPMPPPELCLSIICPWRTLDLVVEAPSQRGFMVRGLRRLITPNA